MARLCLVIFLAIYAFGLVASNLEREERKINWGKNAWGSFAPDGYFNGKPQTNKVTKSLNQYRLNYILSTPRVDWDIPGLFLSLI